MTAILGQIVAKLCKLCQIMQIECKYFIFEEEMKLFCLSHSVWNKLICQETVKLCISLSVYVLQQVYVHLLCGSLQL